MINKDYIKLELENLDLTELKKVFEEINAAMEYADDDYIDDDCNDDYACDCDGNCDECEYYYSENNDYDNDEEQEDDIVNHPSHYTNHGMECIYEMVMLYGFEETMSFCKLNAHKYRKRAMDKGGRIDLDKSDWYVNTYKELYAAKESGLSPIKYVLEKVDGIYPFH